MSTGYAHKRGGGARGNQWGQAYGSHGGEAGQGEMRLGIDFPYVCERCLGPNPYVQMIKSNFGGSCKISKRPFHVFKWTNPKTRRRMKTVISYEAASVRNCCQACMSDMTYGVPLVVRDALLKAAGMQGHEELPKSEVGQSFFFNQRDREAELIASGAVGLTSQEDPRLKLDSAASQVWQHGSSGGGQRRGKSSAEGGNTLWIASQPGQPLPDEASIRGAFMSFGSIRSVRCLNHKGFAFLEFESSSSASAGLAAGVREIAGHSVIVKWARSKNKVGNATNKNPQRHAAQDGQGGQFQRGHNGRSVQGNTQHASSHALENRPLAAALDPALWVGPSAAVGVVIPPAPPGLRAFLPPETMGRPPPALFPIPTFEQAKKLYPSLKNAVKVDW